MSSLKIIPAIITKEWNENPLRLIILLAILSRIVAVIFSKGFGWFDDHFLIIESSQSWVDGFDYNKWLPSSGNEIPTGHNLFYAGIHYIIFKGFASLGFTDPQAKMYIIRLLHAALSIVTVVLGYRITFKQGGLKAARLAGLLLAVLWLFPFLSVRNLIEFTCVPFLVWGSWILMNKDKYRYSTINGLIAGLILGLAFCMRFQSLIYIGGIGLALLLLGRWKTAFMTGIGILITAFVCLGSIDIYLWGYPFAELIEYVRYNIYHSGEYIIGPWYQYLLVIFGILIPPISLFLVFGMFYDFMKDWKKNLIIFLPSILFLLFHSYFPSKQERFILPIIPFIIIMGTLGWVQFKERSGFWKKRLLLYRGSWIFFWVINIVFLAVISTTYSKRARVETASYLSKYDGIKNLMIENTNQYNVNLLPMYYLGQWATYSEVSKSKPISGIFAWQINDKESAPDFFIFEGAKNIKNRVSSLQEVFPDMVYETTIQPGMIDRVLFWLNPVNENQNAYIYRNSYLHPNKID